MKPSPGSRAIVALFILVLALAVSARNSPASAPALVPFAATGLDSERKKADQLVQTLRVQEVLGPLAPIALSPFFALTLLSGASLLADTGILPDAIARNALLGSSSPLNNGFVFAGLLALTVATALPKLTKVTKPLGQAIDQLEAHAGIVSVVAVQMLARLGTGEPVETAQAEIVYQAGVFSFSVSTLLAAFSAINIFVVNTVKYFFEVLIWISPFPAVDAAFEAANKAFAAFLLGLYLISPWLATLVNLLIFAICLVIFAWAYRRVVYMRSVCGDPLFGWIAEAVFRRPKATVTSTPLPPKIAAQLPSRTLVLKAFAGKGYRELKRKSCGYLVLSAGRLHFVKPRLLRSPIVVALPSAGHTVTVEKGLLSNSVRFTDDGGETAMKVLFTRRYNAILEGIRTAIAGGEAGEAARAGHERVMDVSRSVGAAVKGEARAALRAELA